MKADLLFFGKLVYIVVVRNKIDPRVPRYPKLIQPTFDALKSLGGSGTNDEILEKIISNLHLSDEVVDILHLGNRNMSELSYQAAWARTYLKIAGVISNSARSVWSINPSFQKEEELDIKAIVKKALDSRPSSPKNRKMNSSSDSVEEVDDADPDEVEPWKTRLADILKTMNPYGFERLSQRMLRECGFSDVKVTKQSGDGGIDGTGKLKINGIFSFNVAFQCKRYSGSVGAPEIRDFRGSLTTNIEKGVFITTGTFTQQAREEAAAPGKQQIDLMDGEEFINKILEYRIGVKEVTAFEIDEEYFQSI